MTGRAPCSARFSSTCWWEGPRLPPSRATPDWPSSSTSCRRPRPQLVVIANAIQDALSAAKVPLAVFAAGLPQTPEAVMEAASFTERFDFRVLEPLDRASAERALVEPALAVNVNWDTVAAAAVLDAAGGSPYLIQRLGDEAWVLADPQQAGDSITPAAAADAIEEVQQSLSAGMFRGRWRRPRTRSAS